MLGRDVSGLSDFGRGMCHEISGFSDLADLEYKHAPLDCSEEDWGTAIDEMSDSGMSAVSSSLPLPSRPLHIDEPTVE